MSPEDTKIALRSLVNVTIKGDPDDEGQRLIHDVLQAKMQARIVGPEVHDDDDAVEVDDR